MIWIIAFDPSMPIFLATLWDGDLGLSAGWNCTLLYILGYLWISLSVTVEVMQKTCYLLRWSTMSVPVQGWLTGWPFSAVFARDFLGLLVAFVSVTYLEFSFNASSKCVFAKWKTWKFFTFGVLQSRGLEGPCPEVFRPRIFKAGHRKWERTHWSHKITACCWDSRWRPPDSHCPTSKSSCDPICLCSLVLRRWHHHHMGRSGGRCWLLCCEGSLQECAGASGNRERICCNPGRWISGYVGPSRLWRWQLRSPRPPQERTTDSGHRTRIRCSSDRWIGCVMGRFELRWWQFCSARSASWCAAASGHKKWSICCDPGRWVSGDLGWRRLWWRQFCSQWSAPRGPLHPGVLRGTCRCAERRLRCNVGGPSRRWRLLGRETSAQRRSAASGEPFCVCCCLGEWISCYLGEPKIWRW